MFNHIPLGKAIPKLVQVTDNGTRYYVTPEGFKYPSITTVLSQYNIKHIMVAVVVLAERLVQPAQPAQLVRQKQQVLP